jgi:hypothetical protein
VNCIQKLRTAFRLVGKVQKPISQIFARERIDCLSFDCDVSHAV